MASRLEIPEGSCAALSSGSAALELALRVLGIGAGDRVLIPTLTFVASANAVTEVGGIPVFCDVDPKTWNLDCDLAIEIIRAAATTPNPIRAVMWVDLYGATSSTVELVSVCDELGVLFVEDAAEAVGSHYAGQPAGTFGAVGAFSFNGNKIMTTSGGGMLIASPEIAAQARWLGSQAREPGHGYVHREQGFNFRMSNVLAAIGRAQLARLDEMIERRRAIRHRYALLLEDELGLSLNPLVVESSPNHWLSVLHLPEPIDPVDLIKAFETENIEARRSWKPMHQQPMFSDHEATVVGVADRIFSRSVCLPSGSAMTTDDQDRVLQVLRSQLDSL